MEIPDFLEFGSGLINLEKTRNFNVFGDYSLEPFRSLLDKYKWRERKSERLRISVVGTNGKGSISHYLAQIFSKLGFHTGLYTSPHLLDPKERIRLGPDFYPVNEKDLMDLSSLLFKDSNKEELSSLSWFEWFTLGAFVLFENRNMTVQIYEAGLGGRLDATKLAEPDIVFLGAIGEDHKAVLGNTKDLILKEKLGILSDRTKQVFALDPGEFLRDILQDICKKKNVDLFLYPSLEPNTSYLNHNVRFVISSAEKIRSLFLPHTHLHLTEPSLIQPEILFHLNLWEKEGIHFDPPPGRLEVISSNPLLLYDPAHNPDAVRVTLSALESLYPNRKFSILAGFLPDKEGEKMAEDLLSYTTKNQTQLHFLRGNEFKLPEGKEAFEISIEDWKKNQSILPGDGVLALGSFRLYSYLLTRR